jgi:hypothetical protein
MATRAFRLLNPRDEQYPPSVGTGAIEQTKNPTDGETKKSTPSIWPINITAAEYREFSEE